MSRAFLPCSLMIELLLCVTLVELLNTTTSCNIALTTSEERMALGAYINSQLSLGGAGSEGIAATANNLCLMEFWMNTCLHSIHLAFPHNWESYKSSMRRLGPTLLPKQGQSRNNQLFRRSAPNLWYYNTPNIPMQHFPKKNFLKKMCFSTIICRRLLIWR